MPRLYMVRHGHAAAGFGEAADPGLDDLGREQAQGVAKKLAALGPLKIFTSPLARTRQTAEPLAQLWTREPIVEDAVAEIPSPPGMSIADRAPWLRGLMGGSWRDVPPMLAGWRESVIVALLTQSEDAVIFTHFIAINVAAGAALEDDRFILFSPDYCSVTVFDTDGTKLTLIERGHEARTKVN